MKQIEKIRKCFETDLVFYTRHAKAEMRLEEFGHISDHEVYEAICMGEIIENYPEDTPYPSCLISGLTTSNRPLHIVCAHNETENIVIIITVYHPDPKLWVAYKRRK